MTPFDSFYEGKFMNHKNVKTKLMSYKSGRNPFTQEKYGNVMFAKKKSWVQEEVKLILTTMPAR